MVNGVYDDRPVRDVPAIPTQPLTREQLFPKADGPPQLAVLREHLQREGRLTLDCAKAVLQRASAVFDKEPNMLELNAPVTICGDIHGQYYDLMKLLSIGGEVGATQYLFLGDYVDRGLFACEVVFYLYCLKIANPKSVWLLRGNHECRRLTAHFTFLDECTACARASGAAVSGHPVGVSQRCSNGGACSRALSRAGPRETTSHTHCHCV
jgi:serine/threonine-protein phosphatase 2B catalytic subunit